MSTIIERVKSFEDACKALNRETTLPDFSMIPEKDRKPLIAHFKLIVICEALNEGHVHDWNNGKWDKWYPWFYMRGSSSSGRFSFIYSDYQHSHSNCSSRLCFKSEELADYAGTQFEELYKEYFVID
ncbi:hypothetical protein HX126_21225 [Chryseobacterium indologenes]|uniref:hypothetical protein n=1 Tax=Chryseobacterium indologenes TaxID=253 RepID=UPI002578018F|nr:hypothetical protein [Chryseobacterium indologenes]MDM1557081.1 hypothetical protein [Chryseobacterium indologenes]